RSVCCYGFLATRGRDRYLWFWVFRNEVLSVEEGRATFFGTEPEISKKLQSLIPGVVELRFAIRLLLRVRGDERKRSHIVVLGGSK
ncbi:hypothetical protein LINPERPRIM_LOCUS21054, partial [Linum perenne]